MPKLKREIKKGRKVYLNKDAKKVRGMFVRRWSDTQEADREYKQRLKKKYLVKGRIKNGDAVWDVFSLSGDAVPQIEASGFTWKEEAIAFARDRSLGRMSFKAGNIRGLFTAGKAGIVTRSSQIETPGKDVVKITHTKDGVIIQ